MYVCMYVSMYVCIYIYIPILFSMYDPFQVKVMHYTLYTWNVKSVKMPNKWWNLIWKRSPGAIHSGRRTGVTGLFKFDENIKFSDIF